jgi:hypothetical protein
MLLLLNLWFRAVDPETEHNTRRHVALRTCDCPTVLLVRGTHTTPAHKPTG